MSTKTISALKESILDLVPGLRKVALERGHVFVVDEGGYLCREGERLDGLFIPLNEAVQLHRGTKDGDHFSGFLQKGRSLCLRDILFDRPASYSAVASGTTRVIKIPIVDFLATLDESPSSRDYLTRMVSSAGSRGLKSFLSERDVPGNAIIACIAAVSAEPAAIAAGVTITRGEPGIILVDRGALALTPEDGVGAGGGSDLGEGMWFGGESLVPPHNFAYSAVAKSDAMIRFLPLARIKPLLDRDGILEILTSDPWLTSTRRLDGSAEAQIRAVPGESLSQEQLLSLGWRWDPGRLKLARSDSDSILASIANLSVIRGFAFNLHNIQVELGLAPRVSFMAIAAAVEHFGAIATQISSSYAGLSRQDLPCLAMVGPRMMVLLKTTKTAALLVDPCRGPIAMRSKDFEAHWDQRILEITRSPTDELPERARKRPSSRNAGDGDGGGENGISVLLRPMLSVILEQRVLSASKIGLGLLGLALATFGPQIAEYSMDEVLTLREVDTLLVLVVGSLILLVFNSALSICRIYVQVHFSQRLTLRLSELLYRKVLATSLGSGLQKGVGDVQMRFHAMEVLTEFLAETPVAVAFAVLTVVINSVILFGYSGVLALMTMSLLPITLLVRVAFRQAIRARYENELEIEGVANSLIAEQVGAIASIKAAAAETIMRHKWEEASTKRSALMKTLSLYGASIEGILAFIAQIVQVGTMWIGCRMASRGEITYGEVLAVSMYAGGLIEPLASLAKLFDKIENARVSANRVAAIFTAKNDEVISENMIRQSVPFQGKIRLDRIGFRYSEDSPLILKDINLTIYSRQVVAVVGRSGCGKTTLANIIAGNLEPSSGRLFFDGYDSQMITASCRRRQIGIMMQDSELFAGTIEENIAYSDDAPDLKAVAHAAAQADALGFIMKFPQNFNTYLAEGGMGLSGGQKQRISIARTLYRDPRILIMDEATSALDAESEAAIVVKMREILRGRTALIIAHRLSTIKNADRIIVMDAGEIVEEGDHGSLMRARGMYFSLFETQLAAEAA